MATDQQQADASVTIKPMPPGSLVAQADSFVLPPEAVQAASKVPEKKAELPPAKPDEKTPDQQEFALPADAVEAGRKAPRPKELPSLPEAAQSVQQLLAGNEPDIDYQKGAPFNVQLALARADNPDEAAAALERRVGPGNFGQDRRGTWWIKEDGKKVAVRPQGSPKDFFQTELHKLTNPVQGIVEEWTKWPWLQGLPAELVAGAPATGGAVLGGALGAEGGPFGVVAGAGLGSAFGKGLDEAEKELEGTRRKTPKEETGTLAREATVNAALSAAPALGSAAKRGVADFARWWFETTPKTESMAARLIGEGMAPPLKTIGPGSHNLMEEQRLRNIMKGNPEEKRVLAYLQREIRNILTSEGLPPEEADAMLREIYDPNSRISTRDVGEAVGAKVGEAAAWVQGEVDTAVRDAESISRQIKDETDAYLRRGREMDEPGVRRFAAEPTGRLGHEISETIVAARRRFAQEMRRAYEAVDSMTGHERIVSIAPFRTLARSLRMTMPPNELPPILEQLAESDENIRLTFREAHDLRTVLRDMARRSQTNLTPTVRAHNILSEARQVDDALEDIADLGDAMDFWTQAEGLPQQAVAALRRVDEAYREGIERFKGAMANKIVRDARDGDFSDAGSIARMLMAPGHLEETRTVLGLLPQDLRTDIARSDAADLIHSATDPTSGQLSGKDILKRLHDREPQMRLVYPPEMLAALRRLGQTIAAQGGDVPVTIIHGFSPDALAQAEARVAEVKAMQDRFFASPLGALRSGDPKLIDQAADMITRPGAEATTEHVMRFLGEGSPEWQKVRTYALKKLLTAAIDETDSQGKRVVGNAIDDALGQYSAKQQDMLFPAGLKEDLRLLAKDSKFLLPFDPNDFASSQAARAIQLHMPWSAIKWTKVVITGWLAEHPVLLRTLARMHKDNPSGTRDAMRRLGRWILNTEMMTGPGKNRPTPQIQQPPPDDPLERARDAIRRGAPRDAVMRRLQESGLSVDGL